MRRPHSVSATRGLDVPALPTKLLISPSGYARTTDTASTIVVVAGEDRTSGTSG
jgi:hypothetical protein